MTIGSLTIAIQAVYTRYVTHTIDERYYALGNKISKNGQKHFINFWLT
jgi:hypothetical protein